METEEDIRLQHEEISQWKDARLKRLEQFTAELEGVRQWKRQSAPSFGQEDQERFRGAADATNIDNGNRSAVQVAQSESTQLQPGSGEGDSLRKYVQPTSTTLSAANEESELAMLKGLRSGKVTI